ncbi:hypothetical protein BGZ58_004057, partial [Dissophora ornata]
LFAAGNFEAAMRMLDTIVHAAMAKMVEGRERGVQTEPVSFLDDEDVVKQLEEAQKKVAAAPVTKGAATSTSTSATTTTAAATETSADPNQPQKQLQWVTVPTAPVVVPVEDDDDEDRVVEWLLGGW